MSWSRRCRKNNYGKVLKTVLREREGFRSDTLKAWSTYQSTGQHVAAEEAEAWLKELEQGKDEAPPESHF